MSDAFLVRRGGSGGLSPNSAVIHVTAPAGSTISFAKGGVVAKVLGPDKSHVKASDNSLAEWYYAISPINYGEWTVTASLSGDTASDTVTISTNKQYDLELSYHVPSEYQAVEYLQATETQKIITGYKISSEFAHIKIKFSFGGRGYATCGTYKSNGAGTLLIGCNESNTIKYILFGSSNYEFTSAQVNDYTSIHILEFIANNGSYELYFDGALVSHGAYSGTVKNNDYYFRLFGSEGDYPLNSYSKICYFETYDENGNLTSKYLPCYRKSDSVAGMWEALSRIFYANNGTGTFRVGPDIM